MPCGPTKQSYDEASSRIRTTWPDSYYVTYDYDDLNRMSVVKESGTTEVGRYIYDPLSRRTELQFAATATNKTGYTYEPDGDLDVLTQTLSATSMTLDFGHNHSHQITSILANDDFYLAKPTTSSATTYAAATKLNQYPAVGGTNFTYDFNGNLLTWMGQDGIHTYTYDSENRLKTAAVAGSSTVTIQYAYDPLGRRYSKTVGGTATTYLSDGDEEIAEYNGATLLAKYITGPAVDDRIAMVQGTTKTYFHVNHQGSVIAMADTNGNYGSQRFAYDAYGNLMGGAPSGVPFRYTGRRFDPETGLYYYRARYYAPQIGRFLQTDPVGHEDDNNLYSYVGNDPLDRTDPSGNVAAVVALCVAGPEAALACAVIAAALAQKAVEAASNSNSGQSDSGKAGKGGADTNKTNLSRNAGNNRGNGGGDKSPPPPDTRPPSKAPEGAGRRGAFNAAKQSNDVPRTQQPSQTTYDRSTGQRTYTFDRSTGGRTTIRDDAAGHEYADDPAQNRGGHFNDEAGNHYDYEPAPE